MRTANRRVLWCRRGPRRRWRSCPAEPSQAAESDHSGDLRPFANWDAGQPQPWPCVEARVDRKEGFAGLVHERYAEPQRPADGPVISVPAGGWSNPRLQALVDQLGKATAAAKCLADELDELVVQLRYPTRHRRRWRSTNLLGGRSARSNAAPSDRLPPWRGQLPHRGMGRPRPHHHQRDQRHSVHADRPPAPRPHPLTGRRADHPRGGDSRPGPTRREPEPAANLQHQREAPRFAGEQRARTDPHAASRARNALTAQVARSRGRGDRLGAL
jgi:hypothetical protein